MSVSSYSDQVLVLHSRPFQETSLVIECLGVGYGRYSLLARGARKAGRSNKRSELQMTAQLNVQFRGKSDLKTLIETEVLQPAISLSGDRYAIACYVSEVALRILQPQLSCSEVFFKVENIYNDLRNNRFTEANLRAFELSLLDELGEGVDFLFDVNDEAISSGSTYIYRSQTGFEITTLKNEVSAISGDLLLKIAKNELDNEALLALKHLTRRLLSSHLGTKPLRSRELWRQWVLNNS